MHVGCLNGDALLLRRVLSTGLAGFLLVSVVEVAACPGVLFLLAVAYYFSYDSVKTR